MCHYQDHSHRVDPVVERRPARAAWPVLPVAPVALGAGAISGIVEDDSCQDR